MFVWILLENIEQAYLKLDSSKIMLKTIALSGTCYYTVNESDSYSNLMKLLSRIYWGLL